MPVRTSSVVAMGLVALAMLGTATIFGGTIAALVNPTPAPAGGATAPPAAAAPAPAAPNPPKDGSS